jgi:hypothetical protein
MGASCADSALNLGSVEVMVLPVAGLILVE